MKQLIYRPFFIGPANFLYFLFYCRLYGLCIQFYPIFCQIQLANFTLTTGSSYPFFMRGPKGRQVAVAT